MAKQPNIETMSYEEAFQELEGIVTDLEAQVSDLDQAIKLFERGQALAKHCSTMLEKAELKVQEITEDGELKGSSED
jgi:exodeoxyribonuclease VII small subunit